MSESVIKLDDGQDVFVHYTDINMKGYRVLVENDVVEFDVTTGSKGLKAADTRATPT